MASAHTVKTTRPVLPRPAPIFQTTRLLLRPYKEDDLSDFFELRSQFQVMQWTSTGKVDADQAFTLTWMKRALPPNDVDTFTCAIEELSNSGKVIGAFGILPKSEPPEIGYMLREEAWGRGLATEAMKAFLELYWKLPRREVDATEYFPELERRVDDGIVREVLHAQIVSTNSASQKVLEKCGFVRGRTEPEDPKNSAETVDLVFYYLERPMS